MFLYTTVERRIRIVESVDPNLMIYYLGHVEGNHCDANVVYVYIYLSINIYFYIYLFL